MHMVNIKKYLFNEISTPYFVFVGDSNYSEIKKEILELGLVPIRVSDYCMGEDKLPSTDALFRDLEAMGKKENSTNIIVIGLGEHLALKGNKKTNEILSYLKDLNIGRIKVIFLLRGIPDQKDIFKKDIRKNRNHFIFHDTTCNMKITKVSREIGLPALDGFKKLLIELENSNGGEFYVNSILPFNTSSITIKKITNSYEGIKKIIPRFIIPNSSGTEDNWSFLLKELLTTSNMSIDDLFKKYNFDQNLESDFHSKIYGNHNENWLFFIALKYYQNNLSSKYIKHVLDISINYEDFLKKLLTGIIDIPHTDNSYLDLYRERKKLIIDFRESEIADFVLIARKKPEEIIYKLTDQTKVEREEIINWISKNGTIPELKEIYPALTDYLDKYVFSCGPLSDLFTQYFDEYKFQKVTNQLNNNFLSRVQEIAISRVYNRLSTRNEILDSINKENSYLFWLDALGVEYLGYISKLAYKYKLNISIKIARAKIPTITELNRDFYDNWPSNDKIKNDELDEVKHKDKGGYNFEKNQNPIHLARELEIIENVIERAATVLSKRQYERFILASDHGASRLAVIYPKDMYESENKGKYSGRFCELYDNHNIQYATEENGYLVLANYGRFKGSRAADVEVHGGASLEEVLVPIIELSLKDDEILVELLDDEIVTDFSKGAEITLFVNMENKKLSVIMNGIKYTCLKNDGNYYSISIPELKRAGLYYADVYINDNFIKTIHIKAQGRSARVNNDLDDLF